MATNYLYIDDEQDETVEGIKNNLDSSELTITVQRPKSWDAQIEWLIDKQNLNEFDGLLIDLKLEFSDADNKLKYFGPDLAQAIRTKVKSGQIKDLPLLLCTTDQNLMRLFDKTSADLFDRKYDKKKDFKNENSIREFIAFAEGYKILNNEKSNGSIFNAKDISLQEVQIELNKLEISHDKSNLIFNHIIKCPGLLIDEDLLAVRLGVDVTKTNRWNDFVADKLSEFKYKGILSSAFKRWWLQPMLKWWRGNFKKGLQILSAEERVKLLNETFPGYDLVAVQKPTGHLYTNYWYICKLSNCPLEASDGFMTANMPKFIWQESSYISMAYVLSDHRDAQKVRSMLVGPDLERFEAILTAQRTA